MEPFKTFTGFVAPLDKLNVDTDQIIPKQFLKLVERKGFGKHLFFDWRFNDRGNPIPDFILNQPPYKGASILLTRANFGCGSSREHAVWALADYGFKTIIASSFGEIFYNNSFKNGLLLVTLTEKEVEELFEKMSVAQNNVLTIDLAKQTITRKDGIKYYFDIHPFHKKYILEGLDEIALTLKYEPFISNYEVRMKGSDRMGIIPPTNKSNRNKSPSSS